MSASRRAAFGVLVASLAAPVAARAETPGDGLALAQTLFDEGVSLMEKSDYAAACPKLAESQRLDPAGGTLLNLGLCREREGKLAAAWIAYNDALSQSVKDGRKDREITARQRIDEIAGRVSKVVVEVTPAAAAQDNLTIALDGTVVRQPAWGVASPIDPGEHELVISARGRVSRTQHVVVSAEGQTLRVEVRSLGERPQPETRPSSESAYVPRRSAALVVGGAGVALVVGGAIAGIMALDRAAQSDAACPSGRCSQRGADLNEQAGTFATLANVTFAAGAAALLTSAVLIVTLPKVRSAAAWMGPLVGPASAGISAGALF